MKTSSRSDSLRSWLLTLFAWEPVMCRMWQASSGKGMSLGLSGVHASLSWMARVEGPAQPGFLTLSKYFLCWSFNDLVWSPLITHLIWCSVFLLSFKIWSSILYRASCASSRLYYFLLLCVWQPWNTWKSNWAGPFCFKLRVPLSSHYFWFTQFAQPFCPGPWVCAVHFISVPFHVMPGLGVMAHVCCGQSKLEHYQEMSWLPFNAGHTCQCLLPVASRYQPTPLHPPPSFSFNCCEAEVPVVVLLIFWS